MIIVLVHHPFVLADVSLQRRRQRQRPGPADSAASRQPLDGGRRGQQQAGHAAKRTLGLSHGEP
jgi:hypothetical protein